MQTLNIAAVLNDGEVVHDESITSRARGLLKPGWTTRFLNSAICCGCLLLLSPAIVAVWIAIHRSSATGEARLKQARKSTPAARPIRIVMKADPRSPMVRQRASDNMIRATTTIAAHAAL